MRKLGAAEVLFEYFSIDNLLKPKTVTGWKSFLKEAAKQAGVEGSEEMASDLINWAGDVLIAKDKSQWKQAIQAYMAQGMGEKEAFQLALKDQAISMGMSGLGGTLSGGLMSGGSVAVNGVMDSYLNRDSSTGQEAMWAEKTAPGEGTIKANTTLFSHEILANLNQARKTLIQFARANFPGAVQNLETGKTIKISRNGLDKFLSGRLPYEKYATGFHIPELVEKAHKVGEAADVKGRAEILGYEYYESPITVDEKEYMAYIRVRETKSGDSYYGHTIGEIEDIKIEPSARVDTQDVSQPVYAIDDSTFDSIIPQTGDGVNKKYAKKGAEYTEKPKSRLDMGVQASKSPDSRPSLISDQSLNELMSDQSFLNFLKRKGDLKLTKDMTRDQKRMAIREAVEKIARRETTDNGIQDEYVAITENVATSDKSKIRGLVPASIDQLKTFVRNALQGKNTKQYIKVADVDPTFAEKLKPFGIEIKGFAHLLKDNDVRHINKSHGKGSFNKYKVTEDMLINIQKVISDYDTVYMGYETSNGNQTIVYERKEGTRTFYVEEVLEEGGLSSKQMIIVGESSKPSFLKKYKKLISRTSDTDVAT